MNGGEGGTGREQMRYQFAHCSKSVSSSPVVMVMS